MRSRILREVRGYVEALVVAFLVVTFLFTTVGVVGASMLPSLDGGPGQRQLMQSLLTGDRVFIPKYPTWLRRLGIMGGYERGDIVVLREPVTTPGYLASSAAGCLDILVVNRCQPFFIKRIVGLPGDVLFINEGQLVVNNQVVDQGFISSSGEVAIEPVSFPVVITDGDAASALQVGFIASSGGFPVSVLPSAGLPVPFMPVTDEWVDFYYADVLEALVLPADAPASEPVLAGLRVPEGHYFIMGDNRSRGGSLDSRHFGFIASGEIAGRATAVIWPPRRDGEWNWRLLTAPGSLSGLP